MMHPDTELRFISEQVGHGVVATRDLPAGTITWVQDELDREMTPGQVAALGPAYLEQLDTYCFRNQAGNWVLCWDHARFVNHSFRSNCLTTAYNFEIAIRDIRAGEELTDDYGYLNIQRPFRPIDEGCRRKVVHPDDLLRYHGEWDRKLLAAWPRIIGQQQALGGLIGRRQWGRVKRIAEGREPMASIRECYCGPDVQAVVAAPIVPVAARSRSARRPDHGTAATAAGTPMRSIGAGGRSPRSLATAARTPDGA